MGVIAHIVAALYERRRTVIDRPYSSCAIVARTDYMKVAVVHDWLNGMRGGEKVLEAILDLHPEADVYTLFHEAGKVSHRIESHRIFTSWLERIPGIYHHYRNLLPLFPAAVQSWDLSGYDLV